MPCKFPAGHPDENNNFGNAEVCSRYGGQWIPGLSEPTLDRPPLVEPSLMRSPAGMTYPNSNLGGASMNLPTRTLGTPYTGGPTQTPGFFKDTNDFGQPLDYNAGPQGGVYNLFGERDRILAKSEADNFGPRKVAFDSKSIPEDSLTDRIKMRRRAQLNPPKDSMGLYGGKPTIPYTEEDARGVTRFEQQDVDEMRARKEREKVLARVTRTPGEKTTETPAEKAVDKSLDVGEGGLLTGKKDEVESGLGGLWSNMQKPGYWSTKVEGGAGDWDNRLFRLGEMMSYMGTPLSKRGKNPAERWTTASAASAKAAGTAAGTLTKNQRDSYNKMIPNKDTLIKMFLKKKKGIFSDSKPGTPEYAVAASQAARYAEIGHQLIIDGIEPTSANIEKRRKELQDKKK